MHLLKHCRIIGIAFGAELSAAEIRESERTKAMKQLTIFGDSVMKGVMYNGQKYSLYKSELEKMMSEKGICASKNCKMGATITKAEEIIKKACPEGTDLHDTVVLLEYGGNDSTYDWKAVSENPLGDNAPMTSSDKFVEIYIKIINYLKSLGATVCISTLVPIDAEKYMNFISKELSYDNLMKFLGDTSMLYRWHEIYNNIVVKIAEETGSKIIDLRSQFLKSHNFSELLSEDGIHPTEKGHKLIEETLVNTLAMC